ncbi:phage major capsid protein (plasmid) [Carnobacterium maltaromaticum]|uniref:phage major capsid protein n=1 Tax=Carnobacterium maltaromaticum TaxID=2751 RepID=UPI00344E74D4
MNIKDLNDTWISAGQKVSDLNAEVQKMLVDDSVTAEQVAAKNSELKAAKAKRDLAFEQYEDAKSNEVNATVITQPLDGKEKDLKMQFVEDFKAMVKGDPQIKALLESELDTDGNGVGLTIPVDIRTTINMLRRQYDSLEQYVKIESVTTASGSRVYEKWSDITPLAAMDDDSGIIPDNDDPTLTLIKYLIKRYAGINTLTNTLLKDTAENILAFLTTWIARKTVVTRNKKIIDTVNTIKTSQKVSITKFDDIKDVLNTKIDPAILSTTIFITNQSGFNILDKVKRSDGSYLLQPNVQDPTRKLLDGRTLVVIGDRWLPNTASKSPIWIGDLKEAVTLFDREQMSLKSTDIGGGAFETDTTKVRVIDRFDVVLTDEEAIFLGSFSSIEDETPVTP